MRFIYFEKLDKTSLPPLDSRANVVRNHVLSMPIISIKDFGEGG